MKNQKSAAYRWISLIIVLVLALLFTFPLYWIVTGSFKTAKEINSTTPVWWPTTWTLKNYQTLMGKMKAPLWEIPLPFSQYFSSGGEKTILSSGPQVPAAIRWMLNTIWMAVAAMFLTCLCCRADYYRIYHFPEVFYPRHYDGCGKGLSL